MILYRKPGLDVHNLTGLMIVGKNHIKISFPTGNTFCATPRTFLGFPSLHLESPTLQKARYRYPLSYLLS